VEPPGRQGRVLLAYLVMNRARGVSRDELLELLWPERAPADPGEALSALLSRLRRELGEGVLNGRRELRLALPPDTVVDVESAFAEVRRADTSLAGGDHAAALEAGQFAEGILAAGFLPGDDLPWVEERRRELGELRLRTLEVIAAAGMSSGGPGLTVAEHSARTLVAAAPFRESGYRLLMEALAARGDSAEALRAYDQLRVLLREELGSSPGPAVQDLHQRLLRGELAAAAAPTATATPEERKLVTVLCAEPAPSGDPTDPEELRAALVAVHERLREIVESYGGVAVEPSAGSAVALFGAGRAHEDDAERAVRAALGACGSGDARRAAVTSGEALVGGVQGAITGQVVTAATKLLHAVPLGGVAVDGPTRRASRRAVAYAAEGGVALARGVRAEAPPHDVSSPMVGRGRELAALEQLYGTVIDHQRPRLVMLTGAAGIGKTRLADELALRVGTRGARVLHGRCLAYGEGVLYWPLREILWESLGITLDDRAAVAAAKLRRFTRRGPLDESTAAALAASSGISLAEGARGGSDLEEPAEGVDAAWPLFFGSLAAQGPSLVVIEDIHWADGPLLTMLERIVAYTEGPLMLLATARPEFAAEAQPAWGNAVGMSQIALERLSAGQSLELVQELLPDAGADVHGRVAERAEGNPFFVEELARHVGSGSTGGTIPDSVRTLLAARIDALPAAEKTVLQHAAVVGRRFWASALEPNETGGPLEPRLAALEERGLVLSRPVSSLPGEHELSFGHGLTREVAYRSIPHGARCRTHAAVAGWIERLAGDRRREFIDLIAYHYEAAATPRHAALAWPDDERERERVRSRALRTLLEAGSAARKGLLSGDGVRFAHRALALASSDRERLAATELLAGSYYSAVKGEEALAAYLEAIELARAIGEDRAAVRLRAYAVLLCSRYMGAFKDDNWMPVARRLVTEGLEEVSEDSRSFEAGALLLGRSWGRARWRDIVEGDVPAARADMERSLEIAEEIGSSFLLAHALEGLTWLVFEGGFSEAEAMGERLVGAAASLNNRVEAHESLGVAAICFTRAGRFDRAREVAAETGRLAAGLSPHRALHAGAYGSIALMPPGRFRELLAATENVVELAEREGDRVCATGLVALAGRALALFEAGDDEDELERTVGLLHQLAPIRVPPRGFCHPIAEMLRPVIGCMSTLGWMDYSERRQDTGTAINRLRAFLPVAVAAGERGMVREAIGEARALAGPGCAPALACIADWASAAELAADGCQAEAVKLALAANAGLESCGEPYTAGRLLVDLLPLLDTGAAAEVAEVAAPRLERMGAHTSASVARAATAPVA
jgi:DNA-binding SARP family transcriptional activator/tetratricopeptide (TPR) repeat protein